MTRQQENEIIEQARVILERRMGEECDIKVNLGNVIFHGAYLQGALVASNRLADYCRHSWRGEEKVYLEAELKLILSSKRNIQLFLEDTPMRYRNHKRDKKGKLESVECYYHTENRIKTD